MRQCPLFVAAVISASTTFGQTIIHTRTSQFAIQEAIDVTGTSDEVVVDDGVCRGSLGGNGNNLLLADVDGVDNIAGTEEEDLRLLADSPRIDAGRTAVVDMGARESVRRVPADFDGDGDVDQSDLQHLRGCLSGPSLPQGNPGCLDADLDGDEDVDQSDFGLLQCALSVPNFVSAELELNYVSGGSFSRSSSVYDYNGDVFQEYPADVRRDRSVISCSASDGRMVTGHVNGVSVRPFVAVSNMPNSSDNGLYGRYTNDGRLLYRSADGLSGWTLCTNMPSPVDWVFKITNSNGYDRLLSWLSVNGGMCPYYSDNGTDWTRATATGGSNLVMTGTPSGWGFTQNYRDTIVAATYFLPPGATSQIWRSTDYGVTWTSVLQVDGCTIKHFHAVGYHKGTDKWIVNTGDGAGKMFNYVSTDDGETWNHYDGVGQPATNLQVTRWRDYGDATKLVFGSDAGQAVGLLDMETYEAWVTLDVHPVRYVFELVQIDGLWYAGIRDDQTPPGKQKALIMVSEDLKDWAVYHQFGNTNVGLYNYCGSIGDTLHFMADDDKGHFVISKASVSLFNGLTLAPGRQNYLPSALSKGETLAGWTMYGAGTRALDSSDKLTGDSSLKGSATGENYYCYYGSGVRLNPGAYTFQGYVNGAYLYLFESIYGENSACSDSNNLNMNRWQEFCTKTKTIAGSPSTPIFRIYCYPDGNSTLLPSHDTVTRVDALGIYDSPASPGWVEGGTVQAPEKVSFNVSAADDWTHVFSTRMYPSSDHLSSRNAHYVTYVRDPANYVELYYDVGDYKIKLRPTVDGISGPAIMTSPKPHFHKGSLIRFVVRHFNGNMYLSLLFGKQNDDAVSGIEHVVDATDFGLSGDFTIVSGDSNGENVMPGVYGDGYLYNWSFSNEEIESLLSLGTNNLRQ